MPKRIAPYVWWLGSTLGQLALCLVIAGAWSVLLGLDDNWDLQNYHIYNPATWLSGRLGQDLNVVGNQSTFYPLLDVPYYGLAVMWLPHMPRLVCFLAGLPYGVLAWLVFRVARELPCCANPLPALLASGIGLTGTTAVSEIGTTFGDIPIAVAITAGLWLALRGLSPQGLGNVGARRWHLHCAGAGACCGLAAGLKLTAGIYAPALLLALLICGPGFWRRFGGGVVFGLAVLGIFVAVYGVWGLYLFRAYQNPVFPFLNNFFSSSWGDAGFVHATKFFPRSWAQALFYPFWWLRGKPMVASETGVRDWHFAVAMIAFGVLSTRAGLRWLCGGRAIPQPERAMLCCFVFFAYVAWEDAFSILRYAIPLEVLTGLVIVAAIEALVPPRRLVQAGLLVWAFLLSTSGWPGWGRVRSTPATIFDIRAPVLADNTTVAVASEPVGFVIPFLRGRNLRFVGVLAPPRTRLDAEIAARLTAADRLGVLLFAEDHAAIAQLAHFGVRYDPAACQRVTTSRRLWGTMVLCPAWRDQ